jgi:hypothetical protein
MKCASFVRAVFGWILATAPMECALSEPTEDYPSRETHRYEWSLKSPAGRCVVNETMSGEAGEPSFVSTVAVQVERPPLRYRKVFTNGTPLVTLRVDDRFCQTLVLPGGRGTAYLIRVWEVEDGLDPTRFRVLVLSPAGVLTLRGVLTGHRYLEYRADLAVASCSFEDDSMAAKLLTDPERKMVRDRVRGMSVAVRYP